MSDKHVNIAGFDAGNKMRPFFLAGPCVLEDAGLVHETAAELKNIFARLDVPFVFKASFDKANRTSIHSFRGPGLEDGLRLLSDVKVKHGVSLVSDVHEPAQIEAAAEVLDVLQIPAFLCRQTDLVVAAAKRAKALNIKKGQFLAPWDMKPVLEKALEAGAKNVTLTERGASFGYNNLVVDMRSLHVMKELGAAVVFDCTHSVQLPGGLGSTSGGQREFIPSLMRAAAAVGVAGYFLETHPDPSKAQSDGANAIPLGQLEALLRPVLAIDKLSKELEEPVLA